MVNCNQSTVIDPRFMNGLQSAHLNFNAGVFSLTVFHFFGPDLQNFIFIFHPVIF